MYKLRTASAPVLGVALAITAVLLQANGPSAAERAQAKKGLEFERHVLPRAESNQRDRPVQPALEPIQPWISSVGASVGATDLRGLGYAGDACLTDPRDDKVRVFTAPGSTGTAIRTFTLEPTGLPYDKTMAPIGCVPADISEDGLPDFLIYYWGRSPVIFVNQGQGSNGRYGPEDFMPTELVTPMEVWNSTALNVADVDGDGHLDVFVGNYFPDGARVLDPDAEDDARMEMQHSMGKARNAGTNRLFLSRPQRPHSPPQFTDVSIALPRESAQSWTLATGFQDLSGNGYPDLYVANDFGPDQLLINHSQPGEVNFEMVDGDRDLTTPRSKVLGHDSFKGMGVAYSYEQGANLPSIYVSNITSEWALQESNLAFYPTGEPESLLDGDLPYDEHSTELGLAHSGWSWDIKAVDLTNQGTDDLIQVNGFIAGTEDMWPRLQETAMGNDLILSNPEVWLRLDEDSDLSGHEANRLWRKVGDKFVDAGEAVPFTTDEVSRGIATTDVNGDGRYDFLVANQWGDSYGYVNRSNSQGNWATLNVTRPTAGRPTPLIGATVILHGPNGYTREAQLYPGNGHSGVADSALHFGIPSDLPTQGWTAEVRWPHQGQLRSQTFPVRLGSIQDLEVTP